MFYNIISAWTIITVCVPYGIKGIEYVFQQDIVYNKVSRETSVRWENIYVDNGNSSYLRYTL